MGYLRDPAVVSFGEFRNRLTEGERADMYGAMASHWQIADFITSAGATNSVNLADAGVKAIFISAGVLPEDRAAEVFMVD